MTMYIDAAMLYNTHVAAICKQIMEYVITLVYVLFDTLNVVFIIELLYCRNASLSGFLKHFHISVTESLQDESKDRDRYKAEIDIASAVHLSRGMKKGDIRMECIIGREVITIIVTS